MTWTLKTRRFFDGERLYADGLTAITIRGDRVADVSMRSDQGQDNAKERANDSADTQPLDASSLTILPGLIDAHFHPVSASFDIASIDRSHPSLRALDARRHLE